MSTTKNRKFTSREVAIANIDKQVVWFSGLYRIKKNWLKLLIAALLGIFLGTVSAVLIQSTGLYTGGLGAFFQGVARVVNTKLTMDKLDASTTRVVYNAMFWGMYVLVNVPLTIFAYKKVGRFFALQSITFLVCMQAWGFLLGNGFFSDSVAKAIQNFSIFGDTSAVDGYLKSMNVKCVMFSPNYFPADQATGEFDWINGPIYTYDNADKWVATTIITHNIAEAFLLFVYSAIYAAISGFCYTLVFILGGSTAGSDYISVYMSQTKNKEVGSFFIIFNASAMFVGILLGSYVSAGLSSHDTTPVVALGKPESYVSYWGWQYIFTANLFASLMWVVINGLIMDKLFPWHKMICVRIYSRKYKEINEYLFGIGYTHPITLIKSKGGSSGIEGYLLETVCLTIEFNKLVRIAKEVDPNCFISSNYVVGASGKLSVQRYASK